jgi:histidinol-phosphatase
MSQTKVLFVDRDGTLIEEPPDEQVDSLAKIRFMPDVFPALREARKLGFKLAIVTNQDGLGTASFPQANFDEPHQFMMDAFASQGIEFDAVFVCPHRKSDGCDCRKPKIKLVADYVREKNVDLAASAMIGDRDTDLEFAKNLGVRAIRVRRHGAAEETWPAIQLSLGEALRNALGDKLGIARYGFVLPMDEAQVRVAIDLSGRAYGVFEGKFNREAVGGLPTELVPHFFKSLAESLKAAVHVTITGENTHHMIEACFKGVGRALRQAFRRESEELPSTKGVL